MFVDGWWQRLYQPTTFKYLSDHKRSHAWWMNASILLDLANSCLWFPTHITGDCPIIICLDFAYQSQSCTCVPNLRLIFCQVAVIYIVKRPWTLFYEGDIRLKISGMKWTEGDQSMALSAVLLQAPYDIQCQGTLLKLKSWVNSVAHECRKELTQILDDMSWTCCHTWPPPQQPYG
jgi:hypothetical protein